MITRTSFSCLLVSLLLVLLVPPAAEGIDFGKIFQRNKRKANAAPEDPEAQANQVLSYKTACDTQLAQSLVILGEQKAAAEEALTLCRVHRATARSDVEYLVKKVDIQRNDLDQAEERCEEKVVLVKQDSEKELQEIKMTLNETDAAIAAIKDVHSQALQELHDTHQSTMQELKTDHQLVVEEFRKDHYILVDELKEQLTTQKQQLEQEREAVATSLQTLKSEHRQAMQSERDDHLAKLQAAEQHARKKLEQTKTTLKSQIDTLGNEATTCAKSLHALLEDHQKLKIDYELAREVRWSH
jgi:DNA repair exonuclease SbcCD ATPase subunit